MKKLRVKRINPKANLVVGTTGEWIDISIPQRTEFKKGEPKFVKLGIAVELPTGYEAIIAERSSTFKRYGLLLSNAIGVIDNAYNGDTDEWGALFYPTEDVSIPEGTRLLQFRIQKCQPKISIEYVESLNNSSRGGFGSTGI